jgi:hypothetical protein
MLLSAFAAPAVLKYFSLFAELSATGDAVLLAFPWFFYVFLIKAPSA